MSKRVTIILLIIIIATKLAAQGSNVNSSGMQNFNFEDEHGRNQVTFFSSTPLEDITGTANGIFGGVTFDLSNGFNAASFAKSLKGKISVKVSSINTGIELRNNHLRSKNWLDAEKYPDIIFEIKSVSNVKQLADNKLSCKVLGNFTMHGVTKEVIVNAEVTYLKENEETRKREFGDLLGVHAKFNVRLSDFNIDNQLIGNKVAENIEVSVNIVGSNQTTASK